jgi:hypothetical protein
LTTGRIQDSLSSWHNQYALKIFWGYIQLLLWKVPVYTVTTNARLKPVALVFKLDTYLLCERADYSE